MRRVRLLMADMYSLHETRLSMCGGHHVAAGGGKLHEFGARILGWRAGDVRGDVVNLLVPFGVKDIGKALLSTQYLGDSPSLQTAPMPTLSGKLQALASRS